jgi:hypothetical protein
LANSAPGSDHKFLNADSTQVAISPGRGLLNVASAAISFVLVCSGLNVILPLPELGVISPKLRFCNQHKDEFDTVFIGSSHINREVSPSIFDQVMRENGQLTRGFNFGVNGMEFLETGYVLERLLSTKPRRLKWIFVELDELNIEWNRKTGSSRRALYWHDWRRTSLVLGEIVGADPHRGWIQYPGKVGNLLWSRGNKEDTRAMFGFHAAQFLKNFVNVGKASDLRERLSHLHRKELTQSWLGRDSDGHDPVITQMPDATAALYQKALAQAIVQASPKFVSPQTEQACRQCAEAIRKCGAKPIFLVTPTLSQHQLRFRGDPDPPASIISFNDVKAYPDLYEPKARFDQFHLNFIGAKEFTKILARDFAQRIRENRIK